MYFVLKICWEISRVTAVEVQDVVGAQVVRGTIGTQRSHYTEGCVRQEMSIALY
jgi:hypothetical protein